LESVLCQTFTDYELIVVDDGSRDATPDILRTFAAHPKVRIAHNECNLGQFPTHNRGASLARGKYLKFHHADDLMYPHCLEVMAALMEAFPTAGMGVSHNPWPWVAPRLFTPAEAWRAHAAGVTSMLLDGPSATMFRAEAFRGVGGFDPRFHSGDTRMNLQMAMTRDILLLPHGLWWYRRHEGQVLAHMKKHDVGQRESVVWYPELLNHPDNPLSPRERRAAWEAMAREFARFCLAQAVRGDWRRACGLWTASRLPASTCLRLLRPPASVTVPTANGAPPAWGLFPGRPADRHWKDGMPSVSVLIPAWNAARCLEGTIQSVLAQRYGDWEMVIVDDASDDATFEVARRYADGDRVRCARNPRRLGKWLNHNRCAQMARGRYLKFLHADDLLYPHCLGTMASLLDASDAGMAVSAAAAVPAGARLSPEDAYGLHFFVQPFLLHSPTFLMVARRAFEEVGGFDPRFHPAERRFQLCLARQFPVAVANAGLAHAARRHELGIGTREKYLLGLVEGLPWLDRLGEEPGTPLTRRDWVFLRQVWRYGFALRASALLRTGRWTALADSFCRAGLGPSALLYAWRDLKRERTVRRRQVLARLTALIEKP
jgi:glycosyltransferase involved in cell wall biosynthesis